MSHSITAPIRRNARGAKPVNFTPENHGCREKIVDQTGSNMLGRAKQIGLNIGCTKLHRTNKIMSALNTSHLLWFIVVQGVNLGSVIYAIQRTVVGPELWQHA
jgi:hypothetical protein